MTEEFSDGVLAIVCDGMGGMQNGSAASQIAIAAAADQFRKGYQPAMDGEAVCELLRAATAHANQKVYRASVHGAVPSRMGTTLVAAFARDGEAFIVNVGDSRAYLVTEEGSARQLTTDHTVVQLLYEQGAITADERATHARRNELMRAVGVAIRVLADTQSLPLTDGDRLVLCSDGCYGMISDDRMAELVRETAPEEFPARAIAEANENGGKDNISVVLLVK
ncbi:MAG: protein phosphatase 2C domain-containing protein [Oscillospiraceae bacterium]|nr:serine/threonine-protein phosphatase [Oscillospiraceae bacterium]MCR5306854.1 protein phosphatase 2C domain-containing protein [Oscillospiraceae bacterium]